MPDDLKKKAPQDASKVNLNQSWEVEYWTNKFKCTKEELEAAVHKVGVKVVDIEKIFK